MQTVNSCGFVPPSVRIHSQSTRASSASARCDTSVPGQYCPTATTPMSRSVVSMEDSSQFQTRSPVRQSTKW